MTDTGSKHQEILFYFSPLSLCHTHFHTCQQCMHAHMCSSITYMVIYTCMTYVCSCRTYICTHMYAYTHTQISPITYMHTYICVYTREHASTYITHIFESTHMNAHMHTHRSTFFLHFIGFSVIILFLLPGDLVPC